MANSTPNLTRKTLVLAKTDASFGAANTAINEEASASSNAMLLFDEMNPISMDVSVVEKQIVRSSLTKSKNLIGRRLYNLKPKTMLSNAGGADTSTTVATGVTKTNGGLPPFFSPLLRACGMQQSIGGSVSVLYRPRSSGFESATAVVYADTIKHQVTGLVGTFSIDGTAGEGIELSFDMKGNYALPTAGTLPSPTYPLDEKVLCQSETIRVVPSTGAIATFTPIVRSFKMDLGGTTVERKDANSAFGLYGLYFVDRKPTFELVVEVDIIGNFDPFSNLASSTGSITTHAVSFLHGAGTSAGAANIGFYFGSLQVKDVQYQDDGGIRTYAISYDVFNATDDQDFSMRFGYVATGDLTS
jgi:hypothetical protein